MHQMAAGSLTSFYVRWELPFHRDCDGGKKECRWWIQKREFDHLLTSRKRWFFPWTSPLGFPFCLGWRVRNRQLLRWRAHRWGDWRRALKLHRFEWALGLARFSSLTTGWISTRCRFGRFLMIDGLRSSRKCLAILRKCYGVDWLFGWVWGGVPARVGLVTTSPFSEL